MTNVDFSTKRLADDVYLFRYGFYQSIFLTTGDGVIATDPLSAAAAAIYRNEIEKVTTDPVRYVVYSHDHLDHIAGGEVFADTATFVAHEKTREHLLERCDSRIVPPTETYSEKKVIELGRLKVELLHLGRNHSDNSTAVLIPARKLLFAVDFIPVQSLPYRIMPDSYPRDWIESLKRVERLDFDKLVPAHPGGREIGDKETVRQFREYLIELMARVKEYVDRDASIEEIQKSLKLPKYQGWKNYSEYLPLNIERIYMFNHLGW